MKIITVRKANAKSISPIMDVEVVEPITEPVTDLDVGRSRRNLIRGGSHAGRRDTEEEA